MRTYYQFALLSFRRSFSYKAEYIFGMINSILVIFAGVAIWTAVYGDQSVVLGISKEQAVTYSILAFILRSWYSMDEFIIDNKLKSGEIAADLLKPIYFPFYLFSVIFGETAFQFITKVLPTVAVSALIFRFQPPADIINGCMFLFSLIMSYLLMFLTNYLFWLMAFWVYSTWSLITIKNAVILLLSGATIPLWFLPKPLKVWIELLPFKGIYFTPISIYLDEMTPKRMAYTFLEQAVWIVVLYFAGACLWKRAQKHLVIQGG
ncbi:ABC transporter permease [Paenibacillus wynnii]|uniref:ABC transporter permease n=1 Tax=Paenibacillus wynnii TaxID=268407 RepID=A0A098MCG6_9BACL|nr:ABC-2 family transporter protein [Paenibacillus wynnii]KGE19743.1 hypothetical protein PWYN_10630 [Paenibacillus wynnii]